LGDSQQQFRDRLDSEFGEIFDRLFYEVRQALTESLFRLDLQASFNAPLLEETFQIGEAASDMVSVSQRLAVTQAPQQPSVAAWLATAVWRARNCHRAVNFLRASAPLRLPL